VPTGSRRTAAAAKPNPLLLIISERPKGNGMKILPLALAAALAAHASFAQAQSTGSGISVLPPSSKEPAKETAKEPAKETPSAKSGKPDNQGTTGKASGSRTDNPTNALNDNRVSPTTGNPGIQSGRVK
jgi:hypothetical protein